MIVIFAEKPDMGTKFAAALDAIHLSNGVDVHFQDIGKYEPKIKQQRAKDGYFEIRLNGETAFVTWGIGHLCELKQAKDYDPSFASWSRIPLPYIPEKYDLKLRPGISKQYKIVKSLFMKADEIICATDDDREGDLIFDYVYRYSKCRVPYKRVAFNKQSEEEFKKAFRPENLIDGRDRLPVIEAGRARSEGDFIVGAGPTVALTLGNHSAKPLSVGRVQTATLAMIVKREEEIRNFKPEDYYTLAGTFTHKDGVYKGEHIRKRFENKSEAQKILDKLNRSDGNGLITKLTRSDHTKGKPNLYSLQTLQMEANRRFGYTLDMTLKAAQSLYDSGYTTYPRTDSMHLTEDMVGEMTDVISRLFSSDAYSKFSVPFTLRRDRHYFDNSKVSSHYAIVPTKKIPKNLSGIQARIYDLIAKSVICMVYPEAVLSTVKLETTVQDEIFTTSATSVKEPGFLKVTGYKADEYIPDVSQGDPVSGTFKLEAKKTQPPKRYTDSTLLKAMINCGKEIEDEELRRIMAKGPDGKPRGLGRPSTQASIVKTLVTRGYVKRQKQTIIPTDTGMQLIKILPVDDLKNPVMTAQWEKRLDDIEAGKDTYMSFMRDLEAVVRKWTKQILETDFKKAGGIKMAGKGSDKEYVQGEWNGREIRFNRVFAGHRFTDPEVVALLNGEEIEIHGLKGKRGTYGVRGSLESQTYNNRPFIGFSVAEFLNDGQREEKEKVTGEWHGAEVSFNRVYAGHRFTDEECEDLLGGMPIEIHGLKGRSGTYSVRGRLAVQSYNNHEFIGFKVEEYLDDGNSRRENRPQKEKYTGIFKRKEVSFNRVWGGHRFTDEECEALCRGETITLKGLISANGLEYDAVGQLKRQTYKGHPFYGFKLLENDNS